MPIDVEKMRARREAREAERKGGELIRFDKDGQYLLFLHPPSAGYEESELTDGYPYVEIEMHFGVGPQQRALASLSQALIEHPALIRAVMAKKRGAFDPTELAGEDPVRDALEAGDLDADDSRAQKRFIWGATLLYYRGREGDKWTALTPSPGIVSGGVEIHGGFESAVSEAAADGDVDLTNPETAIFVCVTRKKTKKRVEYDVKLDGKTFKNPMNMREEMPDLVAKIEEEIAEGGGCNAFRYASSQFRTPEACRAAIEGIDLEEESTDERPARAAPAKKAAVGAKKPAPRAPPPAADEPDDELEVEHAEGEAEAEPEAEAAAEETPAEGEEVVTQYVDDDGYPCDADGNAFVNEEGSRTDEEGNVLPVDDEGNLLPPEAAVEEPEPPPPPPPKKPAVKAPVKPAPAAAKPGVKPAVKPAPKAAPDETDAALDALEEEIAEIAKKPATKAPVKAAAKAPVKPAAPAKPAVKPIAKPAAAKPAVKPAPAKAPMKAAPRAVAKPAKR